MKKFFSFIMSLVIIGIIAISGLFVYIIINEIGSLETSISTTTNNNTNNENQFIETASENESVKSENLKNENIIQNEVKTSQTIESPTNKMTSIFENSTQEIKTLKNNKHFYNQLEEYSKKIYTAFENNKENMKTGTYTIQLGTNFNDLLKTANGEDLLGQYYQSAIEAYIYDNPEIFYLSIDKLFLNIQKTTLGANTTYDVYINSGNEANYLTDEFNSKNEVDEAINMLEQIKNEIISKKTSDTYENIKMVHDYLIDNIEYDESISKQNIYNVYGALVNKSCVCEGYARSFKYLLDNLEIPCVLVIGKATNSTGQTENHAWNYVQLDGKWYAVDVTWDDPIIRGIGILTEKQKYKYFMKTESEISQDHIPNGQFTEQGKIFTYPSLEK